MFNGSGVTTDLDCLKNKGYWVSRLWTSFDLYYLHILLTPRNDIKFFFGYWLIWLCYIIGFLVLIIDNQTESWSWLSSPLIINLFEMLDDNHDYFVYKTFPHKSNKPDQSHWVSPYHNHRLRPLPPTNLLRLLVFPVCVIIICEDSFVITSRQRRVDWYLQCDFQGLVIEKSDDGTTIDLRQWIHQLLDQTRDQTPGNRRPYLHTILWNNHRSEVGLWNLYNMDEDEDIQIPTLQITYRFPSNYCRNNIKSYRIRQKDTLEGDPPVINYQ
jgi:hypothetical protein